MSKNNIKDSSLPQVTGEELIIYDLRRKVMGMATALIAVISGLFALLIMCHLMGWLVLPGLEHASTLVQINTAICLSLFTFIAAAVKFVNSPVATLHFSRFMSLLLAGMILRFIPEGALLYTFPQGLWLSVLFAAATVSCSWAVIVAVLSFATLALMHPHAAVFHSPLAFAVAFLMLVLIFVLRWLFDAGLRSATLSHQRVLTTRRKDSLTGLANRTRLMEILSDHEAASSRFSGVAVARLDIDGFGALCDALGTAVADEILIDVAKQLRSSHGTSLHAARIGADDFAVILPPVSGQAEAELRAEEIMQVLAEPRTIGGRTFRITFKAGVAVGGGAIVESAEALLHRADLALSEAKVTGQRCLVSLPPTATIASTRREFEISQAFVGAAARGELSVVYQPIVDLVSGRISKAEALVRWNHPELGIIAPDEFIPMAEQVGAIHEIGDWVATEAARFTARLRATLDPAFQMSINRSPVQFRADGDEEPKCIRIFRENGLMDGAIVFEITEGVLLDNREANRRRLARLRTSGISLSLDDFGTGYSSLAQLHVFEIDIVKIDRRFVAGIAEANREHALCAGIISLAHSLGMRVVAEGVETAEQRDLLLGLRCDFAQGWFFGRPLSADAFEALLRSRAADSASRSEPRRNPVTQL